MPSFPTATGLSPGSAKCSKRTGPRRETRGARRMDVIEAIHTRRSIRSFLPRPVARDVIEQVVLDAAQAPPPRRGNVPWTFNIIEGVDRITAHGAEAKQYARDNHPDEPGWEWSED